MKILFIWYIYIQNCYAFMQYAPSAWVSLSIVQFHDKYRQYDDGHIFLQTNQNMVQKFHIKVNSKQVFVKLHERDSGPQNQALEKACQLCKEQTIQIRTTAFFISVYLLCRHIMLIAQALFLSTFTTQSLHFARGVKVIFCFLKKRAFKL